MPDKLNPPLLARFNSPIFGYGRRRFRHGGIYKQSFWQLHKGNIVVGSMIGLCCAGTAANWYAEDLLKRTGEKGPLNFIRNNFVCSLLCVATGQWWTMATSSLMHLSPLHLAVNMWALWNLGRGFISAFGVTAFAMTWLLSATWGGIVQSQWQLYQSKKVEKEKKIAIWKQGFMGASGAIFGLFFAHMCFAPSELLGLAIIWRPAWQVGVFFAGGSVYCLFTGALPGFGHAGHLGGMVGGVLSYWSSVRPEMRRATLRYVNALLRRGVR